MLPENGRAHPDVDGDVKDSSPGHTQELALSVRRRLKMQAAERTGLGGQRVIVLNELFGIPAALIASRL